MKNKTQHEDKLFSVIAEIFELPLSAVNDMSSQDNIEKWDSLGLINVVAELEVVFDVQFELSEIAVMKNVAIIRTLLKEKGVSFDE
jgi:acyl carrier protein